MKAAKLFFMTILILSLSLFEASAQVINSEHLLLTLDLKGRSPRFEGPNCWNLALVSAGLLPAIRTSAIQEMAFYMDSPLCRNIKNDELKEVGDIGRIRKNKSKTFSASMGYSMGPTLGEQEEHGFILLSETKGFTKNGSEINPYTFQNVDEILEKYHVPADGICRQNEYDPNSKCDYIVSYHRCKSVNDFFEDTPNISRELMMLSKKLDLSESLIGSYFLEGKLINSETLENLDDIILELNIYLAKSKLEDQENLFVIDMLRMRFFAINNILSQMGITLPALNALSKATYSNQFHWKPLMK